MDSAPKLDLLMEELHSLSRRSLTQANLSVYKLWTRGRMAIECKKTGFMLISIM